MKKTVMSLSARVRIGLGVVVALSALAPVTALSPATVAAGGSCTGWKSQLVPPNTIRVFRRATGVVEVVPFRQYVITVAAKEWPGYLPTAVIKAGTVAVKQYGWFYALEGRHRSSYKTADGTCYDVRDTTADQLYKPEKARVTAKHPQAADETWDYSIRKGDRFFLTGYRVGEKGPCASNATGWKLFARTAIKCANELGYNWQQILRAYYDPDMHLLKSDGSIIGGDGSTIGNATLIGSTLQPGDAPKRFDERHAAFNYNGDWGRARDKHAHNRTLTHTDNGNAAVVFDMVGKSLEIIVRRGPQRGAFKVFVDGNLKETVDTRSETRKDQATVFSATWDEDARRTIRIEIVGTNDRPRVDLDAVVVGR